MNRIFFTLLFAVVIFTSGCTVFQIDSKDTTDDYYAPKTSIDDVTYVETTDKPFTEIGTVSVTTERNQPLENVLPKLKQEAGMLGADAITDVNGEATDFWKKLRPQQLIGNAYIRSTYTAKAIVWNK